MIKSLFYLTIMLTLPDYACAERVKAPSGYTDLNSDHSQSTKIRQPAKPSAADIARQYVIRGSGEVIENDKSEQTGHGNPRH